MTRNGGQPQTVETTYVGEESEYFWDHYNAISLDINAAEPGEYVITIPADCLQLASESTGTVYITEPIILVYTVAGDNSDSTDYIGVTPSCSPANNYTGGPVGVISVTWPGVRLVMNSQNKDEKTPVDPSFVNVTVNGNPVEINPDMTGGGRIWVKAQYESDGVSNEWRVDDQFLIELPDMFFFWTGDVKIEIKEGAVTSVQGAMNAPISLNYTFVSLNYDVAWDPETEYDGSPIEFSKGDCIIYAYWPGYDTPAINQSGALKPFYQKETENDNGYQTPATQYMSIEDGKVKFDFSSFDAGTYLLDIPDSAIMLGNGVFNGEATYNFRIVDTTSTLVDIVDQTNKYTVFNMQGIMILETTDIKDLQNLTKVMYIVNGEKLILK